MPLSRRRALAGLACLGGCAATAPRTLTLPPHTITQPPPWRLVLDDLSDVEPALQVAFRDARGFTPLPPPGPRAWRTIQPEPVQTVADFRDARPNHRAAPRDRISVLPLGKFPEEVISDRIFGRLVRAPALPPLVAALAAFFATPVDLLPARGFPEHHLPRRVAAGSFQYDARALLAHVAPRLPGDAHSMLALVNVDLYVWDHQQYAFGWSTLRDRLGVVGFSRLDVAGSDADARLRRGLRVAVHEVGHMFGLGHCQAFACAMNGVADLDELDALPLRLCPPCLRKLHIVTDLDPRARDYALLDVYTALGLADEASWLAERAGHLWEPAPLTAAGAGPRRGRAPPRRS